MSSMIHDDPIPAPDETRREVSSGARHEGSTDIAALSAAVIAVVVGMAGIPGPYDVTGAIVAATLLFLVIGYVWRSPRTVLRSLAVASLLGVIAFPLVAFPLEMAFAPKPISLLRDAEPYNCGTDAAPEKCRKDDRHSSVDQLWLVGVWFLVGTTAFIADRRQQKTLR